MKSADPRRQEELWAAYARSIGDGGDVAFDEQWRRFNEIYDGRDPRQGPPPAWWPDAERAGRSHLGRLVREAGFDSFAELRRWSASDRAGFWGRAIERLGIVFARRPGAVLDDSGGPLHPRWLPGARWSIVDSCLRGDRSRPAIVAGREGASEAVRWSYGDLASRVDRVAHGLRRLGCAPGDAVGLYLPMSPECVAAYLGIIRAGCRAVSVAESFPAVELRRRLEIGAARALFTTASYLRGGKRLEPHAAVVEAQAPRAIVLGADGGAARLRPGDLDWEEFLGPDEAFDPVAGDAESVIQVLFSSGTTGDPKAVPWTQATPIKCAMDARFHQDIGPGDVVAWPTSIGWMMGPWLVFAALVNGATIALYEGLPSGKDFAAFLRTARVTMLGVVPSLVRAWRESGALDGEPLEHVRVFSSTGEPSNVRDYLWLMSRAGYRAPVIEYCGGTEIGGGYLTGTVVQPASPGTFTTAALGLDLVVLAPDGGPVGEGGEGEVFLVPPSIGLSQSLLNRDHDEIYHRGCPPGPAGQPLRRHGDRLAVLAAGCYRAQGRTDDTMNLGGIKVGALELERVLLGHPKLTDCAAVSVPEPGGGAERLVVFAVAAVEDVAAVRAELNALLARQLNPLFRIHELVQVAALPRTASNKLLRRRLRDDYLGADGG